MQQDERKRKCRREKSRQERHRKAVEVVEQRKWREPHQREKRSKKRRTTKRSVRQIMKKRFEVLHQRGRCWLEARPQTRTRWPQERWRCQTKRERKQWPRVDRREKWSQTAPKRWHQVHCQTRRRRAQPKKQKKDSKRPRTDWPAPRIDRTIPFLLSALDQKEKRRLALVRTSQTKFVVPVVVVGLGLVVRINWAAIVREK